MHASYSALLLNKIDTRSIRVPFPLLVAEKIERWRRYTTVCESCARLDISYTGALLLWEFLQLRQDDVILYFTDFGSAS